MKPSSALSLGAALAVSLGFVSAQTFVYDGAAPFSANSYYYTDVDEVVPQVVFEDVNQVSGGNVYSVNPIGAKISRFTMADGTTTADFYDFCAELFQGPTGTSTLTFNGSGLSVFSSTKADAIDALFSNALGLYITQRNTVGAGGAPELYGAALQLALWEIIEEGGTSFTLDSTNPAGQSLYVDLAATGAGNDAGQAVTLANTWLSQINSGTWTGAGTLQYHYGDAGAEQNRLLVGFGAIPEPSVALLGLLGSLLVLRRRR
ncbi:MAG: hypothetical protein MUF31_02185 [Akkermansiaceae bacterium]|jgi:hypothetical protein|nr:hypothetical protein [Akkermansiaceae bacterium]